MGTMDPFLAAGMLLYNLCDSNSAILFDHVKGHQTVWEPKIVKSLVEEIREQIAEISWRRDGMYVAGARTRGSANCHFTSLHKIYSVKSHR